MKFCMVTTFFGPQSFGGDAAYVERLSGALARKGHDVHVIHCLDAFEAVRGDHPLRPFEPPPGVTVHPLKSRFGLLSPIATQATGQPFFKADALRELIDDLDTDVVHFHNISLIGGPAVLRMGRHAVRLMTAHEHWLICPMHLLWKFDKQRCDKNDCVRCALAGGRPPQAWRVTGLIDRSLRELDALIFPSRHALEEHRSRGIGAPMVHLPYFLPDDWSGGREDEPSESDQRPYIAAAGRLVRMKGFQRLIPLMKFLPEVDLRIAGTGPIEAELRGLARDLPNVHFEGLLGRDSLAMLFHGARAVVVPSLFPETFGYVVLEAFAVRTPVIVDLVDGGALGENGVESGGGLGYRTDAELLWSIRRLVHDEGFREELASAGYSKRIDEWSEAAHLDRYFDLIASVRGGRFLSGPHKSPSHRSQSNLSRTGTQQTGHA